MQEIFVEKPYRFVRPVMNHHLPRLMNNRLIHLPLLRFGEKVISVQCRGVEKLRNSLQQRHAVMLVPNHPQTSDPVVMYDLLRRVGSPMFAMASWHLFHRSWFHTSVIRLYGGFSINREGRDKTAINFSIATLQNNLRPLLIFPEGATTRTNESMMPFLDGPSFIARTAARRRQKDGLQTVIFPVAIRYQYASESEGIFEEMMADVEHALRLRTPEESSPSERIKAALEAFISGAESEFGISPDLGTQNLYERSQELSERLMSDAEERNLGGISRDNMTNRIRNLRAKIFPELLSLPAMNASEKEARWKDLKRTYRAWQLSSYPKSYFSGTATRQQRIELASKLFEDVLDKNPKCGRRKAIISVCDPIEVPAEKFRGEGADPLVLEIAAILKAEIARLAAESFRAEL